MCGQARYQRRIALLDLLPRRPTRHIWQVDVREAARRKHDGRRQRRLPARMAERHLQLLGRRVGRVLGATARQPVDTILLRSRRTREQQVGGAPLLDRGVCDVSAWLNACRQRVDQLLQRHPGELSKGFALRLAVVRDDHDLVATVGFCGNVGEKAQHAVKPVEGTHRLRSGRPGMVRQLVVVDEIDEEDGRAASHLLGDDRHVQVVQQRGRDAAEQSEQSTAFDAG